MSFITARRVKVDGPLSVLFDAIRKQYIVRCWFCQTAEFHNHRNEADAAFHNHTHNQEG